MGSLSPLPHRHRELRRPFSQRGRYVRSILNRHAVAFEEGNVRCVNASGNGMLLELPREATRGDLLEVRWRAKGPQIIMIVEVCWSQSVRRSGRRSYRVGCRRVFSTDRAGRVLRPSVWQ